MTDTTYDGREQIDGKTIFIYRGHKVVLLYQCPKSTLRLDYSKSVDEFFVDCPYRESDYRHHQPGDMIYDTVNGCPYGSHFGGGYTCYTIQKLEDYLKGREVKDEMEKNGIKDARRMPDGLMVAADDIVTISIGYVHSELYSRLSSKTFTARIVRFESNVIVLDLSERYQANIIELKYGDINQITLPTKEAETDANFN
jgi:hypothetical protein